MAGSRGCGKLTCTNGTISSFEVGSKYRIQYVIYHISYDIISYIIVYIYI